MVVPRRLVFPCKSFSGHWKFSSKSAVAIVVTIEEDCRCFSRMSDVVPFVHLGLSPMGSHPRVARSSLVTRRRRRQVVTKEERRDVVPLLKISPRKGRGEASNISAVIRAKCFCQPIIVFGELRLGPPARRIQFEHQVVKHQQLICA